MSCLNEEKGNTGIRCNEPQQQCLSSGTRWRTAASAATALLQYSNTLQSSSSKKRHGSYIQIHTRTSWSSVLQYHCNLSGADQGTLLWNRTRCLWNKKRNNNGNNNTQSSSIGSSTMYAYKVTSRLLRRHLNHHRTYFYAGTKNRKMSHTKTLSSWIQTSDNEV